MRPSSCLLAAGALLGLVLSACADDPGAARFVAVDIDFSEAPERIAAGDVEVELTNDGQLPHNVTVEGVGDGSPVVATEAGETATGSVTLEPGEYSVFCSVEGHREAGMELTVVVE